MKKITACVLLAGLSLLLVGCGSANEAVPKSSETEYIEFDLEASNENVLPEDEAVPPSSETERIEYEFEGPKMNVPPEDNSDLDGDQDSGDDLSGSVQPDPS